MSSVSYWDTENNESNELSESKYPAGYVSVPSYPEDVSSLYPSLGMGYQIVKHQIESRSYREHYKPQDHLSDEFKQTDLYRFITDQTVNNDDKKKTIVEYLMLKDWKTDEWKLSDMLENL